MGRVADVDAVALESFARAHGATVVAPFLHPEVVAAARGLPAEVRFGAIGSGGFFAEGPAGPTPARKPFDATVPGFSGFVDRTLTRERLQAQGILVPEAVAEAVARFRRGDPGWTGEAILLLALLTDWVEREHLVLEAP